MSAKLAEMDRAGLVKALSAMGIYDNKLLLASVSLLGTEVVLSDADELAKRWSERARFCRGFWVYWKGMDRDACLWQIESCRYCFRIGSSSFAPPAPSQSPGPAKNAPTSKATETAKEAGEFGQIPSEDLRDEEPGLAKTEMPGGGLGSRLDPSLWENTQQAYI